MTTESSPATSNKPRVLVVQPGARRHYAVPAALHTAGMLERMDTEWFVRPGTLSGSLTRLAGALPNASLRKLTGRRHPLLNDASIRISSRLTLRLQWLLKKTPTIAQAYRAYLPHASAWTMRRGFGRANTLYGFIRNVGPDLCREAQQRGLRVVGDQIIAPASVEAREISLQLERFPGWEPGLSISGIEHYRQLEEATWPHCDAIACMSEFVRDGLIEAGQPPEKLWLLPYPSNHERLHAINRPVGRSTITVGFVGAVGLRKGLPYFFDVAKRLASERIKFVAVGPVNLSRKVLDGLKGRVEIIGAVPRPDTARWFERFDLYYFPSTCEGSAGSVNEAMAAALPVITSPNSGSTVRDGIEGFLTAYDDVDTACERIVELADDAKKRAEMGHAARIRTQEFDLNWYRIALAQHLTALTG